MKLFFAILLMSNFAVATPIISVDCQLEMLAAALGERIKTSTLETILSSSFVVTGFEPATEDLGYGYFPYVITTDSQNSTDGTTVTIAYGAKILNLKTCEIKVKMFAD